MRTCIPILLLTLLQTSSSLTEIWPGEPTDWNGFERYHFIVDGTECFVTVPHNATDETPWVWRARFPGYHPEADLILLERGFHIAHMDTKGMLGSPKALDHWDAFYDYLVEEKGFSKTPALEAVSRGGLSPIAGRPNIPSAYPAFTRIRPCATSKAGRSAKAQASVTRQPGSACSMNTDSPASKPLPSRAIQSMSWNRSPLKASPFYIS